MAKADQGVTIRAAVDIKDVPFYTKVNLTTEWKEYKLKFRDMIPEVADKNGKMTKIYERNAGKSWGNGTEEAYVIGFKYEIFAEDNGDKKINGKMWLDTVGFYGDGVKEISHYDDGYPHDYDQPGKVPSDFVAETTTTSKGATTTVKPAPGTTKTNKPGETTKPGGSTGSRAVRQAPVTHPPPRRLAIFPAKPPATRRRPWRQRRPPAAQYRTAHPLSRRREAAAWFGLSSSSLWLWS